MKSKIMIEELSEEYIILEHEGIIITYANIYQDGEDRLHIGTMITKPEFRNIGYGTKLLEFIKKYADQNKLIVRTESLTCGNLLSSVGFNVGKRDIDFIYNPKVLTEEENKILIFLDYQGQKQLDKEQEKRNLDNYSKTLDFLKSIGF